MKPFERGTCPTNPLIKDDEIWLNNKYQVNIRHLSNGWTWLSIKRLDKKSIHDWRDLQTIKNKLTSSDREGLELYPDENRLVDSSNQYHIWVMPKGEKFPFGFQGRLIVKGHKGGHFKGSGQRDFDSDEEPSDAITKEAVEKMVSEVKTDDMPKMSGTY